MGLFRGLKTALVALIALILAPLRRLARRRAVGDRAWVELELEGKIVRSLSPRDRARAKLRRAFGQPEAPVVTKIMGLVVWLSIASIS